MNLGVQRLETGRLNWHQHAAPYLAIVLSGTYEETGDQGRLQPSAGDVILHRPFERHGNLFPTVVQVANVPLSIPQSLRWTCGRAADPLALYRTLVEDGGDAPPSGFMENKGSTPPCDEIDAFAARLLTGGREDLVDLCEEYGASARSLRRWFLRRFGVTAARFRARKRARQAWTAVVTSATPLAAIAADLGFADQAHMCRSVRHLTGHPPSHWRDHLAV